ncbi:MAG: hypothetical protein WC657_08710, partial [Candidatus Paceibacterota bacterium]
MRLAILIVLIPLAGLCGAPDLAKQIELARSDKDTHAEIELLRRWAELHPGDQAVLQHLATL